MDELALLRQFRADVPRPLRAQQQARERLEQLIAGGRRRRSPRLVVLLAALALLIALGGAAYGLAREYLLGDPAPDPVKQQAAMLNEIKGELIPTARLGPGIRVEETKLAAFLDASTGPVYLWAAPSERGDECWFEQIIGTEQPDGSPNLRGGCGHARDGRPIDWSLSATRVRDGRILPFISGKVGGNVAKLELTSEGETVQVPLQGRYFLFQVSDATREANPQIPRLRLTAYDNAGDVLAQANSRPQPRRPRPIDLNGQTPLIEILTRRTGTPIRLYVIQRDGERCRVLVSPGGTGSSCGGRPPKSNEVFVGPNQIGAAPGGMLLLWGEVGSDITKLELQFEGGRIEELPLTNRFALYQVDPADFDAGRRPLRLVGRDANGTAVGERKLGPWQR
jgi:hypothetical protein